VTTMDWQDAMKQVNTHAGSELRKGELPIASAVFLDGSLVTISSTQEIETKEKLVHAELNALKQADRLLTSNNDKKNCVLVTNLEPCIMCLGAAMVFGVKEIVYSLESPVDGAIFLLDGYSEKTQGIGYSQPSVQMGVGRKETKELFERYLVNFPEGIYSKWVESLLRKVD